MVLESSILTEDSRMTKLDVLTRVVEYLFYQDGELLDNFEHVSNIFQQGRGKYKQEKVNQNIHQIRMNSLTAFGWAVLGFRICSWEQAKNMILTI